MAVAVVVAGGYSPSWTPSLGTSICRWHGPKKTKDKKKKKKAVLRGKFPAINAFLKKQEKSQINHLNNHLRELEKRTKPKVSRRKEIKVLGSSRHGSVVNESD